MLYRDQGVGNLIIFAWSESPDTVKLSKEGPGGMQLYIALWLTAITQYNKHVARTFPLVTCHVHLSTLVRDSKGFRRVTAKYPGSFTMMLIVNLWGIVH